MNTIKWELEDLAFATLYPKMLRRDRAAGRRARARARRVPRRGHRQVERRPARREDQGDGHRPTEALLLDLPEDDRARPRLRRHLRPGRHPGPRRHRSATATRCSARSTRGGTRCRGGSRTTSRCPSSTCTSRCTRRSSGPRASRSSCRSARSTCTAAPSTAWPRTGSTRRTGVRLDGGASRGRRRNDMAWLRQLLDWQRETEDPGEFLESLRFDLSPREVYVFTPKGDVVALPAARRRSTSRTPSTPRSSKYFSR